tara:strand:+ start:2596 stop:2880 length:285 start_codon:yes stop_codon:yes gene_type:complete
MSSYDQGYTCIECSNPFDSSDGNFDKGMCFECLLMEGKLKIETMAQAARERFKDRHGRYPNSGMIKPIVAKVKVGRNNPCPCGSGKKNKKCCKH